MTIVENGQEVSIPSKFRGCGRCPHVQEGKLWAYKRKPTAVINYKLNMKCDSEDDDRKPKLTTELIYDQNSSKSTLSRETIVACPAIKSS